MSRNLPFVSIIVPAKNEARFIGCCLKSLKRQSYPKDRIEILVIDNGSIDNTSEIALSYDVSVYKSDATRIGAVRNFGVEKAKGSFLAFIDADCIADPKWLETVVPYLIENKGIGALGGDALSRPDGTWLERYWFYRNSRTTRSLSSLNGSSICLSKAVLKKVGGFHEKINAGEDTKLSDDIKGLGLKIEWCPSADMIHLGYPRTTKEFFKRQFWLSSSYLSSNLGVTDRMFIFTLLSLISLIAASLALSVGKLGMAAIFMIAFITGPILFFIKKIYGSDVRLFSRQALVIFVFSIVYFIARISGLIYSVTSKNYSRIKN